MTSPITFAVIGDSAAAGVGDLEIHGDRKGWGGYLSQNFRDAHHYANFSRPGAQSGEVLEVQLPRALEVGPDICAVIVGGNDLLRNGFDPSVLYNNLKRTCQALAAHRSEILMVELHDPNQLLRLPRLLKRVLRRRVDSVNMVYRDLADEFGFILIQTRNIPNVHDLVNWHVDRMHPGPQGHQLLAREMATLLRQRGWALDLPQITPTVRQSSRERWHWMVLKGTPWFLKRSVDLLPATLFLMGCELVKIVASFLKAQLGRLRLAGETSRSEISRSQSH